MYFGTVAHMQYSPPHVPPSPVSPPPNSPTHLSQWSQKHPLESTALCSFPGIWFGWVVDAPVRTRLEHFLGKSTHLLRGRYAPIATILALLATRAGSSGVVAGSIDVCTRHIADEMNVVTVGSNLESDETTRNKAALCTPLFLYLRSLCITQAPVWKILESCFGKTGALRCNAMTQIAATLAGTLYGGHILLKNDPNHSILIDPATGRAKNNRDLCRDNDSAASEIAPERLGISVAIKSLTAAGNAGAMEAQRSQFTASGCDTLNRQTFPKITGLALVFCSLRLLITVWGQNTRMNLLDRTPENITNKGHTEPLELLHPTDDSSAAYNAYRQLRRSNAG